jgi:anti-anti-sigma factor
MPVRRSSPAVLLVPLDLDEETLYGFYAEVDSQLDEKPAELVLDCSLLEHVASAHINTLWQARSRCEEAGVNIRLTSVTYGLERVLKVLDLNDFFRTERDGVEARESHRRSGPVAGAALPLALDIPATVDGIVSGMNHLHAYLGGCAFGEMFVFDVETVFYEVATNIRLHGDLGNGERIHFTASCGNGVFRLRFEDGGPRFDPTTAVVNFDPGIAVRNKHRHGFGLVIIRKLVDRISYERSENGLNILNLEKSIGGNGGCFG